MPTTTLTAGEPQPPGPNADIDLAAFRVEQSFAATGTLVPSLTAVPVRKPGKQAFVWVHPGADWRATVSVLITEDDRAYWLLAPTVAAALDPELVKVATLTAYTDRAGVIALWPVNIARDGRSNTWTDSTQDIVNNMAGRWLNVRASMAHGAYLVSEPTITIPAPPLPAHPLARLVTVAFKGKVIDSLDHIVLRRLRGEV